MYYGIAGRQYALAVSPLKTGGEGSIYTINGDSSLLAKVYHPNILDQELEEKLKTMYQNPGRLIFCTMGKSVFVDS